VDNEKQPKPDAETSHPLQPERQTPAAEVDSSETPDELGSSVGRFLQYTVSLPERVVRTTVGIAAGAVKETAVVLVPGAFQSSKSYELLVKNSLRFLAEDVGGVAGEADAREESSETYLARKAVGNFVDLAGLATLHVSPMWFLAIVSDVAYGSQVYVLELAAELQKQGLIDESSTIHHVDDILDAMRGASGEAASLFDTPPLSVDQLKETLDKTRTAIGSADYSRVVPEAEITQYWQEMREIASQEDVSLLGVSGAVTMQTLGKVSTVSHGALTGVQVVGGLFSRHIVGHYVESLRTLRERGFYETLSDVSAPYVEAVWSNFSQDKATWTDEVVSGRALGKIVRAVGGLLGGDEHKQADGPPRNADELPNDK
jgi:hypothetical protein